MAAAAEGRGDSMEWMIHTAVDVTGLQGGALDTEVADIAGKKALSVILASEIVVVDVAAAAAAAAAAVEARDVHLGWVAW